MVSKQIKSSSTTALPSLNEQCRRHCGRSVKRKQQTAHRQPRPHVSPFSKSVQTNRQNFSESGNWHVVNVVVLPLLSVDDAVSAITEA